MNGGVLSIYTARPSATVASVSGSDVLHVAIKGDDQGLELDHAKGKGLD
jgi:hypothetical protein